MLFLFIPIILGSFIYKLIVLKKRKSIKNKHVVITGGSSGIGNSLAKLCIKEGANVTIIARNVHKLKKVAEELDKERINNNQKVHSESIDVSDYDSVKKKFDSIEKNMGPIFMLVNCAGLAICGKTEDMSQDDIAILINTNYLGTLYPIQAVIKSMKINQEGIIVITSSQAGLMGIFGLSVYASTKFALRGLAESLDMEVKPYNISVTLALPADTDTPGLKTENKSKPLETKLISDSGGLYEPEVVAKKMLDDALKGNFMSSLGFESFMLTTLCVGMTPFSSFFDVIVQSVLLGPLRFISSFYLKSFQKIVKKCAINEQTNK